MRLLTIIYVSAITLGCNGCGGGNGGNSPSAPDMIDIVRTPAQLRWLDADAYCKNLSVRDRSGWRLPTQPELTAYAKTGTETGAGAVWSSTPAQPTFHYYVSLNGTTGTAYASEDTSYFYVRCAHD